MPAWARQKNQTGPGKQQVVAIRAPQSDATCLQQVDMAALVSAIV
jgi:hypothetical protein